MDPNETLQRFREAVSNYHQTSMSEDDSVFLALAYEAMEAAEALDAHLSAGGTPPEEWREGPDAVGEEPGDDDRPCPCGVSHTIAEHNYDPDRDDGPDPDDAALRAAVEGAL